MPIFRSQRLETINTAARQVSSEHPSFDRLLDSFYRYTKSTLRTGPIPEAPPLLRAVDLEEFEKNYNLPEATQTIRSLSNIPRVSLNDLADHQKECPICQEPFVTEVPIRIPCGHIFGDKCFQYWIFPYGDGENCPLCRARDIPIPQHDGPSGGAHLLHGHELRMDEFAWTDYEGGNPQPEEDRAIMRLNLYEITRHRLLKAHKESLSSTPMNGRFEDSLSWRQRRLIIDGMYKSLEKGEAMYLADKAMIGDNTVAKWLPLTDDV